SFFVTAPVFSSRNIPIILKIGLACYISFLVFGSAGWGEPVIWGAAFAGLVIKETIIGILIGFIANLFFTAIQTAGAFVDMQMGFGIANVVDQLTGAQVPLIGNFKYIF